MVLLRSSGPELCGTGREVEPACFAPGWPPPWWFHAAKPLGRSDGPDVPRWLFQGVGGVFLPTHLWAKEPIFFFWKGAWVLIESSLLISAAPTLPCLAVGVGILSSLSSLPHLSDFWRLFLFTGHSREQVRAFGESGFLEPSPFLFLLRPLCFPCPYSQGTANIVFPITRHQEELQGR